MSITRIEMHQNHLFHKCKEIYIHKNDVSHLTFNKMINKGFGENNEGILCMKLYITETTSCSIMRTLIHFKCTFKT